MSTVTNADAVAEAAPIVACTISRDVQIFDLLIEDMESLLGEAWGIWALLKRWPSSANRKPTASISSLWPSMTPTRTMPIS